MRGLKGCLLVWLMGCLVATHSEAAGQVKLRLDSAAMLIGSPNRLIVTGPATLQSVDFSGLDTLTQLVITGEVSDSSFGESRQISLPFSVYDSVGLSIPGLPVTVSGERSVTNPVALVVDFPPMDSTVYSYRDIRRERATWSDYTVYLAIGAFLLMAAAAGTWYYLYGRRKSPAEVVMPAEVPPHERALRDLDTLAESEAADKPYYSTLDRILRRYLEGRYEIPALERTTAEVTGLMRERGLPHEGLPELLDEVDLVKFARAELPASRRGESLEGVREFVRITRPALMPVETDASAKQAAVRSGGAVIVAHEENLDGDGPERHPENTRPNPLDPPQ